MEKRKIKHGEHPLEVIKPGVLTRLFFTFLLMLLAGLLLLAFVLIWSIKTRDLVLFWSLAIVIGMTIPTFIYILLERRKKIILYDGGILVDYGTRRRFVAWEHLRQLENQGRGKSRHAGIATTQPVQDVSGSIFSRIFQKQPDKYFLVLSGIVRMPGNGQENDDIDTAKFKRTKFGQVLSDYAPQLFDD